MCESNSDDTITCTHASMCRIDTDSFFARNPLGGLHHLTFRVADLADSVARAVAGGFELIGENHDDPDWREAFVHPRAAHGVLIQFVQSRPDYPRRDSGDTLASLLSAD